MRTKIKRIVVKIGSSVIAPAGRLDSALVASLVKDIVNVEKKGYQVIVVSSGAIACGLNKMGYKKRPSDTHSLMALSSIGQILLMDVFNEKCKKHKRACAQILLTWEDFDERERFINIGKTVDTLLAMKVIPVINENDAISYKEIRFGDNDHLSALVANLVEAEQLIILSDVEGLMDGDVVVREVSRLDEKIKTLVKQDKKVHTVGGMVTKLKAAGIAISLGVRTVIACGRRKNVLSAIVAGKEIGTVFLPLSQEKAKARKRWFAYNKKVKGKLCIDEGAADALLNKGKSLLVVGICKVEGAFVKGDTVHVVDTQGCLLGHGLVNYAAQDLQERRERKFEHEVIHRDNFLKSFEGICYY
ncbi:MAG: glutamate 5-kinase [Candidatus Omnitrophica bacterium]|nr:glutamate 5-kinase [Candidatus Omnitrophota bacterium]